MSLSREGWDEDGTFRAREERMNGRSVGVSELEVQTSILQPDSSGCPSCDFKNLATVFNTFRIQYSRNNLLILC